MTRRGPVFIYTALLSAIFGWLAAEANAGGGHGGNIRLQHLWRKKTGAFETGAAEIAAYDKKTSRLFVINAEFSSVDVLKLLGGAKAASLDLSDLGSPNSVAVHNGLVAVVIESTTTTDPGVVAFYDSKSLKRLSVVGVGAMPDMVCFTPNGKKVLVANEGEPNNEYTIDPEGSISIIDVSNGAKKATVATASFTAYNGQKAALLAAGVRIYGPETSVDEPDDIATVAQDLEPEYITVQSNSRAVVTIQEANAFAVINIDTATITDVQPLGTKDHSLAGNELDASDDDGAINIKSWPVKGFYSPDTIASYTVGGLTYIVSANEGDTRGWDGFNEEERIGGITLDPTVFPDAEELQKPENLGRLKVTSTKGGRIVTNSEGEAVTVYSELYSFGARSFSIWTYDDAGKLVLVSDSGSDFERITAAELPNDFNSDNAENDSFDNRSDDKGPEPEALAVGQIDGRTYAFIGLERTGGIMVYDISDPGSPEFIEYRIDRNFNADLATGNHSDAGPECIHFIPAADNPLGDPLIVVANEITGTTSLYRVRTPGQRPDLIDLIAGLLELLAEFFNRWG
jgi:hypothetical protein